ncbi:hemicentin-1-like, partial [Uloborus diversus]|uniref:hemicentin-1-like n=1 Tax=Uloborus diversus TaxID=327109 RepID=UPI002409F765
LEIQPFNFPQTITDGERVIVACTTKSGARPGNTLTFNWLKDGKTLQSKIQVKTFADFSTIVIDPVTENDSGNYTCAVKSNGLHDTFTASLNVMVPPQWVFIPNDSSSFAGDFLIINCKASGKPQPTISWLKSEGSGKEGFVSIDPNDRILLPANGSLIIARVTKSDEGLYQCLAVNTVGQDLKKVISIQVSEYPKIQAFSFPNDVIVGQKASAACTAISGAPPLDFRWLKNGKELSSGGQITIRTLVDVSVLVMESVDASSSGNYTCFLRTSSGSDSYTAYLDVKEPSSWTNKIHDQDLKAGENASILCKANGLPSPQVIWKKKTDAGVEVLTSVEHQVQTPGASNLLLLNAKPEDSSYYTCEAGNSVGSIISRDYLCQYLGNHAVLSTLMASLVLLVQDSAKGDSLQIQPFSFPSKSIVGRRVSVTCTPISGEKMEFKWYKNNNELLKRMNIDIRSFSDLSTLVIDPLAEEDTGNYTCTVNARGQTASFTTILEVLVPPTWMSTPEDVDALNGDSITLNCKGIGKPLPTVVWYKAQIDGLDFIPISSLNNPKIQSNGSLTLTAIEKEDEGTYKCNVSNGIGSPLLKTIAVRVIGHSLRIQPFSFPSKSVIGTRVSVSCTPTSGEKIDFKWFRNGKELSKRMNLDIRSYPDLSTLVIDPLTEDDSGNYTCIVNSMGFTGSYTTMLDVLVPPSWIEAPNDIDALSGDSVMLNCKGNGKPNPTASWSVIQGDITEFTAVLNHAPHLNGSLHLRAIEKEDEGTYKCNITNGIGPALVKTIVVRVIEGNSLGIQPFSFPSESIVGKRVSVMCSPSAAEKMQFKWLRNGKEITKGQNLDIRSFSDLSALVIDPLTESDTGNYTCVVSTRGLSGSYTAVLEVLVPPTWTEAPTDINALSGDSVVLNCKGTGKPSPTISWSKMHGENVDFVSISSQANVFIHSNGSLQLEPVEKENEGTYRCNISNGIGAPLLKTIALRVIGEDIITIQPFSFPFDSSIGKRVSVTCTPLIGEKMNFKWLRNGKELATGKHNVHILSYPLISNLIIDPLTLEDSGNYTCAVSSRGLSGSYTTSLNVLAPPTWLTTPNDLEARSGDSVTINCRGSGRPEPTVSWTKSSGDELDAISTIIPSNIQMNSNGSLHISSIAKEDEGMYKCNVSNGIGGAIVKSIMIKVIDGNFIKIQPFSFPSDSSIGKRVSVTCTPLIGEKMEFKWLRNGIELFSGKHNINILSLPLLSSLVIDPLTSEDSGNYTCVANARGSSGSFTTALDVLAPSSWIIMPSDADAKSGDYLLLHCKGTGKPIPSVIWSRAYGDTSNYMEITGSENIILHRNGTLQIDSISKEDEGMYKCNISNGIGKVLIKTVMVKVIGPFIERGIAVKLTIKTFGIIKEVLNKSFPKIVLKEGTCVSVQNMVTIALQEVLEKSAEPIKCSENGSQKCFESHSKSVHHNVLNKEIRVCVQKMSEDLQCTLLNANR